jgi:hypothetical protein
VEAPEAPTSVGAAAAGSTVIVLAVRDAIRPLST